uniref:hypothetical protein n=1 Tax=Alistipes sp. TaxID=1872444 RepID=UPI004056C157
MKMKIGYVAPIVEVVEVVVEAGFSVSGDIEPGGSGGVLSVPRGDYDSAYDEEA